MNGAAIIYSTLSTNSESGGVRAVVVIVDPISHADGLAGLIDLLAQAHKGILHSAQCLLDLCNAVHLLVSFSIRLIAARVTPGSAPVPRVLIKGQRLGGLGLGFIAMELQIRHW